MEANGGKETGDPAKARDAGDLQWRELSLSTDFDAEATKKAMERKV